MQRDSSYLSPFVRSYIETALWSSTDEQGTPLDDSKYSECELAEGTIQRFVTDCEQFDRAYIELVSKLDDQTARSFPPDSNAR